MSQASGWSKEHYTWTREWESPEHSAEERDRLRASFPPSVRGEKSRAAYGEAVRRLR